MITFVPFPSRRNWSPASAGTCGHTAPRQTARPAWSRFSAPESSLGSSRSSMAMARDDVYVGRRRHRLPGRGEHEQARHLEHRDRDRRPASSTWPRQSAMPRDALSSWNSPRSGPANCRAARRRWNWPGAIWAGALIPRSPTAYARSTGGSRAARPTGRGRDARGTEHSRAQTRSGSTANLPLRGPIRAGEFNRSAERLGEHGPVRHGKSRCAVAWLARARMPPWPAPWHRRRGRVAGGHRHRRRQQTIHRTACFAQILSAICP